MAVSAAQSMTRPTARSRKKTASDSTSGSSGTHRFCLALVTGLTGWGEHAYHVAGDQGPWAQRTNAPSAVAWLVI